MVITIKTLDTNKKIITSGESALEALAEIEFVLISPHKMGSYDDDKSIVDYQRATTEFIESAKYVGNDRLERPRR